MNSLDSLHKIAGRITNLQELLGLIPQSPARPLKAGHWGNRGFMPMRGKSVQYESDLERDFLLALLYDDDVVAVAGQPFTVQCNAADGSATKYTPDFMTVRTGPRPSGHIVEVKYVEQLRKDWRLLRPRLQAGRKRAHEDGLGFVLLTERQIRRLPIAAMRFLLRYRDLPADDGLEGHLIHRLAGIGPSTPRRLLAAAFQQRENQAESLPFLWKLIARGRVSADLGTSIPTMATPIWIDAESDWRRTDPYSRKQQHKRNVGNAA